MNTIDREGGRSQFLWIPVNFDCGINPATTTTLDCRLLHEAGLWSITKSRLFIEVVESILLQQELLLEPKWTKLLLARISMKMNKILSGV
jgi:predicted ABC-class ATPase